MLPVRDRGSLHADAHVRPAVVVDVDEFGNALPGFPKVFKTVLLDIDALCLYSSVYTLCNGVVSRLVVLRHAYADMVLL